MGYEIYDEDIVTPHRLHALLRLVSRLESPKRQDILSLLQPRELITNQDAAKAVLTAARQSELISEAADGVISLTIPMVQIETLEAFRQQMRRVLLGVTEDDTPNYVLNLALAWYATQNEKVFNQFQTSRDFASAFNEQLFPNSKVQRFEHRKLDRWRDWAAFLGLGWVLKSGTGGRGSRVVFVPDAYERVRGVLPELLPPGTTLRFAEFVERLGRRCPELDGGQLFDYCWKVCRRSERRGNNLSLMLSSALYQLHLDGAVVLERRGDALENWQLYPTAGQSLRQVTHLHRGEN